VWTGLVFAGGRSERMGRDKALLRIGGATLLERAVATVRSAGGRPVVLGPPRPGDLEGVAFFDEAAEAGGRSGPLNALRHGLQICETRIALALACDLPLVPPALLRFLAGEAERFAAVVPRAEGEMQVLCAAYTTGCLEIIERRLAAGDRSVHGFLEEAGARIVEPHELLSFGGEEIFLNVNTPGDLEKAEAGLRSRFE
jgi:molybdopterin-guanine dinucleotide biosynthesis protein A